MTDPHSFVSGPKYATRCCYNPAATRPDGRPCGLPADDLVHVPPEPAPAADDREPKPCPRCGETCTYDGWDHVHTTGLGIGSCVGPDRWNQPAEETP